MTTQKTRARHRADVRPTTFLSSVSGTSVARRGAVGVAATGLAFGLVVPTASATPDNEPVHTVASGDTVAEIAHQYGASISGIIEANGLGADALIFPGDELTVPGGSQAADGSGASEAALFEEASASSSNSGSSNANAILDVARQYVGTPYVWGGSAPGGFDCSGFTSFVFAQVGIDIPRSSAAQRGAGHVVSAADARPGDLVWWPGHVGIYTGDGNHIAARNPSTALHEGPIHRANPTFIRVT